MRKVKLLSFVLILSLVLSACSSSSSSDSKEGDKEVTAWAWNINVPVLEKAAKEFEKDHPDFKLKIVELGREDVYSKLTTGLQAGGKGLPDIVLVEDDRVQGYLESFPEAFMNVSEKGFGDHAKQFATYKIDLLTQEDGDIYGFPFDAGPTGVFYRTDYFEKAGINPDEIKTWDDLIKAGTVIKEKVGVNLLGLDLNGDDGLYRMIMNQQGTLYFNEKGDIDFLSEPSKNAMSVIKKMNDADLIKNTVGWDAWISAMANGDVAIAPSGAWLSGSLTQQAIDTSGKWGVFQLPAFEEGGNRAANLGGSNYVILDSSEKKDEAYEFMEYFATSEDAQLDAMSGGLFPSLNTIYDNEVFTAEDKFFSNQSIWKLFADEMKDIPSVNYTNNYTLAQDEAEKAQSEISNGTSVEKALKDAMSRLENRISK